MIRVKICGLTNLADARAALLAGADLLGFNFYSPSPRYIEPAAATQIIAALRAEFSGRVFQCVGVLVNMPPTEARALQQACALDLLQLSGDETADTCEALAPDAFKALRPRSAADAEDDVNRFGAHAGSGTPRFLIDASHPHLYGGTGATGDWSIARSIAARFPILLAGGLTAANVADAVRAVQPWGVDVASGVERAPGLKDADKVAAFIHAART